MKMKLLGLIACTTLLGLPQAGATTMTFEGVVASSGSAVPVTPYTEAGFTLTNLQGGPTDGIFGATNELNTDGTSVFGFCSGCGRSSVVIELTAVGGSAFSLSSLDAANLEAVGSTSQSIIAIGNFVAGGTITQILPLTDSWTTFLFSGFTNLASVDFSGGVATPDPAVDNLVASSATPLPASLPLFASGLGALGLLGWRRKRKNAAA